MPEDSHLWWSKSMTKGKLRALRVITDKKEYGRFIACVKEKEKGIGDYAVFVDQEVCPIQGDSNV